MTTKTIARVGLALILTAVAFSALSLPAEARPRHASHRSYGLICGATQMTHFGITDQRFRLALFWAHLTHVTAQPGAVVVQRRNGKDSAGHPGGHVSRIVELRGSCRALVADEKGSYERDICSRLVAYVMPEGAANYSPSPVRSGHRVAEAQAPALSQQHGLH